jgi:thiol-disulfide isomerase/thioredoxin
MPTDQTSTRRRSFLTTAAGVSALAAGGWVAWSRSEAAAQAGEAAPAQLWAQVFDSPGGGSLKLAEHRGKPVVLNFWATWCSPCVKEMPTLDKFHRDFGKRGWRVLGLAIDSPTPVKAFLAKTPVSFPIGLAGLGGTELAQTLGNTQGGLPFTVVLGSDGQIKARKLGPCEYADLTGWAKQFG